MKNKGLTVKQIILVTIGGIILAAIFTNPVVTTQLFGMPLENLPVLKTGRTLLRYGIQTMVLFSIFAGFVRQIVRNMKAE